MTEKDIKDLGFEIQHETAESSGAQEDWYYYTLDIGDICLITSDSEASNKRVGKYVYLIFHLVLLKALLI